MKRLLIIISILAMLGGLGCAAMSSYITPATVDAEAKQYAISAGVSSENDYKAWYPNLAVASKLKGDVDAAHNVNQLDLVQLMQKDDLTYSIHTDVVSSNLTIAQQREEMLFGEKGLVSLGLSMMGVGGFAGLLGLMRKRPGDITPQEVESALAQAKGKTAAELSAKDKQFIQVISGVKKFMDSGGAGVALLKDIMDKAQDTETRAAVAVAKANA